MDPLMMQILIGGLAGLAVFLVAYVGLYSMITGDRSGERIETVVQSSSTKSTRRASNQAAEVLSARKQQVQDSIKEMESRQKAKSKVSLKIKLQRAGLDATPKQFWMISGICGVFIGAITFLSGASPLVAMLAAFAGGLGLPQWVLKRMFKRRMDKFMNEFSNAIDVIVRGVKSGLPLNDCLGIIARESPQPIAGEFQALVEQQRVGVTMHECFERMIQRVPLQDVGFFAIVVSIQQSAGGNLSEALGNLSGVLRDRKRLDAKVKALSAEAKASAMILAALPFMVMMGVYFTTPDYIAILWQERVGHFLLVGAAFWMVCGILVMKKMINFKY